MEQDKLIREFADKIKTDFKKIEDHIKIDCSIIKKEFSNCIQEIINQQINPNIYYYGKKFNISSHNFHFSNNEKLFKE
jgi:hypothetical protein